MSRMCTVTQTAEVEFEHGPDIYVVAELELEWVDNSFIYSVGNRSDETCHKGRYEVEMVRNVKYYDIETGTAVEPPYDVKLAIEQRCWEYRFNAAGDEL